MKTVYTLAIAICLPSFVVAVLTGQPVGAVLSGLGAVAAVLGYRALGKEAHR